MSGGRGARAGKQNLRVTLALPMAAFLAGACAKRLDVAEIPLLDAPAFAAAKREEEPQRVVEVVEVARPLPLPGLLKPFTSAGPSAWPSAWPVRGLVLGPHMV